MSTEYLTVDPSELHVDEAMRGRSKGVDQDRIDEMAQSIQNVGQLQPVIAYRNKEGKLNLVVGFTRLAAIQALNESGQKIKIDVKVEDEPKKEAKEKALESNLTENLVRNATSPMDDAVNQNVLRTEFGWSIDRIAKFYHRDKMDISRYKKLLELPEDIQELVHSGDLAVNTALQLLKVDDKDRDKVIERVRQLIEEGKVKADDVKAILRELNADKIESPEEGNGEPVAKSNKPDKEPSLVLSKSELLSFIKSEANRSKQYHSSGKGYYNATRERIFDFLLQFAEGKKLVTELMEDLEREFPHSDQDVAMIPEPQPEEPKKKGRPKKVTAASDVAPMQSEPIPVGEL